MTSTTIDLDHWMPYISIAVFGVLALVAFQMQQTDLAMVFSGIAGALYLALKGSDNATIKATAAGNAEGIDTLQKTVEALLICQKPGNVTSARIDASGKCEFQAPGAEVVNK